MEYIIYKSLTCGILLALLCSSVSSQYYTIDESFGIVSQGQMYVITPGGFKEPPGPGEGAGVVVDPFRFMITGSPGEDVDVVLTLPDSFVSNDGTKFIPLMRWTCQIADDWWWGAWPLVNDTITVSIFGGGMTPISIAATLTVPLTACPGPYTAAIRASFAGKDTIVYRSLETVYSAEAGGDKCLPDNFELQQNYPNPFNPATNIPFSLPKESFVSLIIYDIRGREVSRLVQEVRQPGTYSVPWDAGGVSSGIYFYQLMAGGFVETKKMVLLR